MARSMTGFGSGEYDLYGRKITVDIKSVNSKYLDLTIKSPKIITAYENDIKNIIKEEVSRGKVDVTILIDSYSSDDVSIKLDENLLDKYFDVFDKLNKKYDIEKPTIKDILALEDVVVKQTNENDVDTLAEIWETLFVALNNAISNFVKTRDDEGELLRVDMLQKIEELNVLIDEICELCPVINESYKKRLYDKVNENLLNIDYEIDENFLEQRILTEVCIFSEKSDIDEEIVRFCVNLTNLKNTLLNEQTIGKKIDFILQELNREVNTISSKSNDIRLSKNCISIKVILEKIREQAKNIE